MDRECWRRNLKATSFHNCRPKFAYMSLWSHSHSDHHMSICMFVHQWMPSTLMVRVGIEVPKAGATDGCGTQMWVFSNKPRPTARMLSALTPEPCLQPQQYTLTSCLSVIKDDEPWLLAHFLIESFFWLFVFWVLCVLDIILLSDVQLAKTLSGSVGFFS